MQCTGLPELYDYLYLAAIFITTLLSHWVAIDFAAKRNKLTKEIIALHISALIETCVSGVVSVLVFEPVGSFKVIVILVSVRILSQTLDRRI